MISNESLSMSVQVHRLIESNSGEMTQEMPLCFAHLYKIQSKLQLADRHPYLLPSLDYLNRCCHKDAPKSC